MVDIRPNFFKPPSPCVTCPRNEAGFCGAILTDAERSGASGASDWQTHRVVRAGMPITRAHQVTEDAFVLCQGWAFRFMNLPSGRRQILSFVLPGDLFSISSIFDHRAPHSVRALTDVQICGMKRAEVQSRLFVNASAVTALGKLCSERERAVDNMLAAVAHASAEERIAHLLLHLIARIAAQSVVNDETNPFPLRQQHIADAVGLTSVHVSRSLGSLRERGILSLSVGMLRVFDQRELERLGSL
jgi:CRP-like cAMP-binding protein